MTMKKLIPIFALAGMLAACGNEDNAGANKKPDAVLEVAPVGKKVYRNNCMQCHGLTQERTGPALAGVRARWHNDEAKLTDFIRNSQKVIAADGPDSYAGKLFDKWYKTSMPAFSSLSDDDIKQLLDYVDKGKE